jgi:hypothetical protein
VTIGDTGTEPRIGYTDDDGGAWTWITQGDGGTGDAYLRSRAVGLMFLPDFVCWLSDVPDFPTPVWRWDRASEVIDEATERVYVGSFYGGVSVPPSTLPSRLLPDGWVGQVASIENGNWAEGVDENVRLVGSADGGYTWNTPMRWPMDGTRAAPYLSGPRLGQSDFWVYWEDVADAVIPGGGLNFHFQPVQLSPGEHSGPDWRGRLPEPDKFDREMGGTISASIAEQPIFIAPNDGLIRFRGISGSTVAADPANYWSLEFRVYRAGVFEDAGLTPPVGGGWTAFIPTPDGEQEVAEGDVVTVRFLETGAAVNINRVTALAEFLPYNRTPEVFT